MIFHRSIFIFLCFLLPAHAMNLQTVGDEFEKHLSEHQGRGVIGRVLYFNPITGKQESTQPIRYVDALWAARMIYAEGGENVTEELAATILWTVVAHGWCYQNTRASLVKQFRSFSRPMNPKFSCDFPDGICKKQGYCTPQGFGNKSSKKLSPQDVCAFDRIKDRKKYTHITWSKIPKIPRETALKFALGILLNPLPPSVNFNNDCRGSPQAHLLVNYDSHGRKADNDNCKGVDSFYAQWCNTTSGMVLSSDDRWQNNSVKTEAWSPLNQSREATLVPTRKENPRPTGISVSN